MANDPRVKVACDSINQMFCYEIGNFLNRSFAFALRVSECSPDKVSFVDGGTRRVLFATQKSIEETERSAEENNACRARYFIVTSDELCVHFMRDEGLSVTQDAVQFGLGRRIPGDTVDVVRLRDGIAFVVRVTSFPKLTTGFFACAKAFWFGTPPSEVVSEFHITGALRVKNGNVDVLVADDEDILVPMTRESKASFQQLIAKQSEAWDEIDLVRKRKEDEHKAAVDAGIQRELRIKQADRAAVRISYFTKLSAMVLGK